MVKKVKKLSTVKCFQGVKFGRSLIMILLAALILLISFLIYTNKNMQLPTEKPEEIAEGESFGSECTVDADCQPRCPGLKGVCKMGYCFVEQTTPSTIRCIDLKAPVCGNNICESDEKDTCPEDCF